MRVFLKIWSANNTAGSQAFIQNKVDRDMLMNVFHILTTATEERKINQKDYVDSFGYEGVYLYNELLANIPDEENKALPFVNMGLQA